ncbi:MAG: hypothetical protein ABI743_04290 [bacterium]
MFRGRVQLGLILSLLAGTLAISTILILKGPSDATRGTSVAFAEAPGGVVPGPGGINTEKKAEADAKEAAKAPPKEETLTDKVRKQEHGPDVYDTHAEQTPQQLRSFETDKYTSGIRYSGSDSSVAQLTEKIRGLDLTRSAKTKYTKAEEFLGEDKLGREDPLEITDAVPEELRPKSEFEGLSDTELEQLIAAFLRSYLQYLPIEVIGTIDNGLAHRALINFQGQKLTVNEGQSFNLYRFPLTNSTPPSIAQVGLTVTEVREDFVSMNLTLYYTRANGTRVDLDPIKRTFYIRMSY